MIEKRCFALRTSSFIVSGFRVGVVKNPALSFEDFLLYISEEIGLLSEEVAESIEVFTFVLTLNGYGLATRDVYLLAI